MISFITVFEALTMTTYHDVCNPDFQTRSENEGQDKGNGSTCDL